MLDRHVILGFSDIKSELRTRTRRTNKTVQETQLWFSMADGVLYAHDFDDQESCIAIAIKIKSEWSVKLDPKGFGHPLIQDTIQKVNDLKLVSYLNGLYVTHGYY